MPINAIVEGSGVGVALRLYVADVGAKQIRKIQVDRQPMMSFYAFGAVGLHWTDAGDQLYFTLVDRGPKHVRLMRADPATGAAQQILADSSKSYVTGSIDLTAGNSNNWKVLKNGDTFSV